MDGFVTIVLICLRTVAPSACTEDTAVDVLSIPAESEIACLFGWQEVVGHSAFADEIGSTAYVKAVCRRVLAEGEDR
jgi:hypothetical protein